MKDNEQLEKVETGTKSEVAEAELAARGVDSAPAAEAGGGLTAERTEELKSRAAKADENWDRLLRVTADFDNFKKRAARERQESIKFANEGLLEKLVPVMDNFDMALAAATNPQTANIDSL